MFEVDTSYTIKQISMKRHSLVLSCLVLSPLVSSGRIVLFPDLEGSADLLDSILKMITKGSFQQLDG